LLGLQAVTFESLCKSDDPNRKYWGFIAEDVEAAVPKIFTNYMKQSDVNKEIDLDLTRRTAITDPPIATAIDYRTGDALVPDGVQYDRMIVPMLVIMKDHEARLAALELLTQHLPVPH